MLSSFIAVQNVFTYEGHVSRNNRIRLFLAATVGRNEDFTMQISLLHKVCFVEKSTYIFRYPFYCFKR